MKIKILLLLIIICIPTISLAQTETIEQSEILESQQKTLNISSFIYFSKTLYILSQALVLVKYMELKRVSI